MVMNHIVNIYKDATPYVLNGEDKIAIQNLANEKYSQWHWNYGYSPKYAFQKGIKTPGGHLEVHLDVDKGLIQAIKIYGDFFAKKEIDEVEAFLIGKEHRQESVLQALQSIHSSDYFNNISEEELVSAFF
jgi:lipoate-protein ligase A